MRNVKDFLVRLDRIIQTDTRYNRHSYFFVMTALSRTIGQSPKARHISGRELLQGIRREARDQFGPMAGTVFCAWGLKDSLDFGRVVFNMVHEGILSKTDSDRLEDFHDEGFFENLFDENEGYRIPPATAILQPS